MSGMTFIRKVGRQLSKRKYGRTRMMLQPQTYYQTKVHVNAEGQEIDFLKNIAVTQTSEGYTFQVHVSSMSTARLLNSKTL